MADDIDCAAVHIENNLNILLAQARYAIPTGKSLMKCEECGGRIPQARRKAIPGVRTCVVCQGRRESQGFGDRKRCKELKSGTRNPRGLIIQFMD